MRREFPAKVKVAAFERCKGSCEECTCKLATGAIHYDHVVADGLGGEPVLDNCAVLCRTCHDLKTRTHDVPAIAKGKRVRRRQIGIRRVSQNSIQGWRRFDGTPVRNPKLRAR